MTKSVIGIDAGGDDEKPAVSRVTSVAVDECHEFKETMFAIDQVRDAMKAAPDGFVDIKTTK